MWTRLLRSGRLAARSRPAITRRCINDQSQGPHTTYFQQPPEPPKPRGSLLRSLLWGSTILAIGGGIGFYYGASSLASALLGGEMDEDDEETLADNAEWQRLSADAGAAHLLACRPTAMPLEVATKFLDHRKNFAVGPKAVTHIADLPSNMPCEDTFSSGLYGVADEVPDPVAAWASWGVYDGHAGPATSNALGHLLVNTVGMALLNTGSMDRSYVPNDPFIIDTIKRAFLDVDARIGSSRQLVEKGRLNLTITLAALAPALSGSCALLALFDPVNSVLRVANVGDSRAVLGRWDTAIGKYTAQAMSVDQTGFNPDEVERLRKEHPGEDPVDPKTGRVHGLAVSRAFGDFRWKWPQELSQTIRDNFWGNRPRPKGLIVTPPYLTAEPEIMETKIQTAQHADFLILASDGLWDLISSEDAVTCVQHWLEKNKPDDFLSKSALQQVAEMLPYKAQLRSQILQTPTVSNKSVERVVAEEDTYFDENEGVTKWRVSPKHFVVEDDNCGVHLIKNALGGNRRNLFCGLMSLQPPLSRDARDDITVQVIFFGEFQESVQVANNA